MDTQTRRLKLGIVLVVLLAVQAIAARPLEALAELGAVVCCEDHCDRGEAPSQASRCCGVDPIADELSSASLVEPHPPSTCWVQPASKAAAARWAPDRRIVPPRAGSSPLYLVTRSLLI